MEYQIAILRDKYEYLGEKYCTEYEGKLAMLRDFPPLNYLFIRQYRRSILFRGQSMGGNGGSTGSYAGTVATEAGDEKLGKMLRRYEKIRIYQMPKR